MTGASHHSSGLIPDYYDDVAVIDEYKYCENDARLGTDCGSAWPSDDPYRTVELYGCGYEATSSVTITGDTSHWLHGEQLLWKCYVAFGLPVEPDPDRVEDNGDCATSLHGQVAPVAIGGGTSSAQESGETAFAGDWEVYVGLSDENSGN